MPLTAIAINDFNTPLMRETRQENELKVRVTDLYEQDKRLHEFNSGTDAIAYFQQEFLQGQRLYIGMFNDKPICAVGAKLDTEEKSLKLTNLAMHTQNLNRGIETQFIALINQSEQANSTVNPLKLTSDVPEILAWIAETEK